MSRSAKAVRKRALLLLLVSLVVGCGPSRYEPIRNVYRSPAPVTQGSHRVKAGETLYSIAWRYNRNHLELAKSNGISAPYAIYPGQLIDLSKTTVNSTKVNKSGNSVPVRNQSSRYKKPPSHAKPVQEKVANQRHKKVDMSWSWPAKGSVIERYSLTGSINKGIDLSGRLGEPVYAAADGEVVYSGAGIVGFRNLIIIKHNAVYLSAYAHNSKLLVREGQRAKAGQKIAEIGSTGASRDKLHFEIRRSGKPVNPLQYLPKR